MSGVKQTRITDYSLFNLPPPLRLHGLTIGGPPSKCAELPTPLSGESTQIPVAPGSIWALKGFVSDSGLQKVVRTKTIVDRVIKSRVDHSLAE